MSAATVPRSATVRMERVAPSEWPRHSVSGPDLVMDVWLSRDYLAVLYLQPDGFRRLTVNRTEVLRNGRYRDGITWDELQRVKRETVGDVWAVEVYPPDKDVVDVQNMRHLFVLSDRPEYAW